MCARKSASCASAAAAARGDAPTAPSMRKAKKTIRLPTLEEIEAIEGRLPGPYKLLVWLMAGCGLRIGEACAVTLQQFDFEAGLIYVDRQITRDGEDEEPGTAVQKAITKGRGRAHCVRHLKWRDVDEGRAVPLPPSIAAEVREHVWLYGTFHVGEALNRLPGDYLFCNVGRTNILMYSLVDRLWRKAEQDAGITRTIPRTGCATSSPRPDCPRAYR
ncbi:tyrosine-type recombinase/integrase [Streptomyces sp. NPDC059447]|uniref:tyrosine-type recombinase/integrase n=1 Tax=Streptomyces sp. NPDC059447 TaxID=3346834 RepID=UPI0036CFE1CC